MSANQFLIYGANGYVGEAASRLAVDQGLRPILAGRDARQIEPLAAALGVEARVFSLDDAAGLDRALEDAPLVLHLAGPFIHTSKPMVDACLRAGAHYLDITGELPVLAALAARDAEARGGGVMLMPAVGLDAVPTDCLAAHLQRRLPTATRLTFGIQSQGPAGLPPGTQRTMIELAPRGERVIRGGALVAPENGVRTRTIDFGQGPVACVRFSAADPFVAHRTTGIPDIEAFVALPSVLRAGYGLLPWLRPLLASEAVQRLLKRLVLPGPSPEARAKTVTHVWGEVGDAAGRVAVSRLHGPEGGLVWTTRAALTVVRRVLAGDAPPGYQTPAGAYGPDLVLAAEGVTREDVVDPSAAAGGA